MLRKLTTSGDRPDRPITIGDKMRMARHATGADQASVGAALDVSRQTVIDWERGHRRPSEIAVFAWAHVTGADFEWLWNDEDTTVQSEFPLRRKGRSRRDGARGLFTPMVA